MQSIVDASTALMWARLGHSSVIFVPIAYIHFVRHSLKVPWLIRLYRPYYVVGIISLGFMWTTDLYVRAVHRYWWGFFPKGGVVMVVDLFILIAAVLTAYGIFIARCWQIRKTSSHEANKLRYGCAALTIFSIALLDFIPKLTSFAYYPLGFATTATFVSITSYAILKHRLMDITIAIRKSLLYSVLIAGITVIYLLSVLLTEKLLQGMLGYQGFVATVFAALIVAVWFIPFKNSVQCFIDRAFFHGTQVELAHQREQLLREVQKADQLKAVSTMAAGLAHEIKNPLAAIKTFAEFLPERGEDPVFQQKFRRIVTKEVDKIDHIVRQLLDFARPAPPSPKPLQVSALLDETLEFLSSDCLKRRVTIQRTYAPDDTICADPQQLRQVFLNLLLNSLDAMEERGGLLSIRTGRERKFLAVTIQDAGVGISKEHLERLFEPFFTTKIRGTGLGLAIVRNIVTEHDGTIAMESELGHGTRCLLKFPLLLQAAPIVQDSEGRVAVEEINSKIHTSVKNGG